MIFTSAILSAIFASASLVSAAPATQQKTASPVVNIVFNPVITYPTAGVVWTVGETQKVTWDTAELPQEIINSTGTVLIGYNEDASENLDIAHPLATGFKLTDGQVNVTVPDKDMRSDYIVVLFGDSGNASPEFTILPAASSSVSSVVESITSTISSVSVSETSLTSTLSAAASSVTSTLSASTPATSSL